MDSKPIALALEEAHPSPSLHLDSPYLAHTADSSPTPQKIEVLSPTIITPLVGFWIPLIPEKLLNPPSKEYFIRTREARYGVSLAQVAKAKATEEAWIEVLPPLKELGALLGENEEGHFLMGKTPSYADLVVVGWLQFFKAVDEAIYKRVVEIEPKLGELYNASKQWVKRDDH
ncbi:hypothetical protein G7Y89_g11598 [Cudoniella acicularis]|uniref:Glutathione S-transferase UstS-like C-terminal domain-containing protein n=1 Tax=Cudoniella acicularis TaxID=354080 RepID=A0A8H4RD67_9HELO|nr:hypothetical protein G7Y89_g11598 [Cudoniella acicularis]